MYEEYFDSEEDAKIFKERLDWLQDDYVTRIVYDGQVWIVKCFPRDDDY